MAVYHVIPFTSLRLGTQYKEGALVFSILREGDTVEHWCSAASAEALL